MKKFTWGIIISAIIGIIGIASYFLVKNMREKHQQQMIDQAYEHIEKGDYYLNALCDIGAARGEYRLAEECTSDSTIKSLVTYRLSYVEDTCIRAYAFYERDDVESFEIPEGITTIEDGAFEQCDNLTSIDIPNSVRFIGDDAFALCDHLTSITFPNSVISVGMDPFCGHKYEVYNAHVFVHLPDDYSGHYTIPNGIETIGERAFAFIENLTSVTIPNSVTHIAKTAFYGCKSLRSVTLPNSVVSIGKEAFDNCPNLEAPIFNEHIFVYMPKSHAGEYTIPEGIEVIADGAFDGCTNLTSVNIPNSVTTIGNYAFYGCENLTSMMLPDNVTSIGDAAFGGCYNLASINIPNSVTSIGDDAFRLCYKLETPLYNAHVFAHLPKNFTGALYTIPNGIEMIAGGAFDDCKSLTAIKIPNSVTDMSGYIGDCLDLHSPIFNANVFAYLPETYEGEYVIPEGIKTIAHAACYNRENLTSVIIPNSVTSIDEYAFAYCYNLTSVTIPNSVTSIGRYAFEGCGNLSSIVLSNSITTLELRSFEDCVELSSVTIPHGVISIGEEAFKDCKKLSSLTISGSVKRIGNLAFCGCKELSSITCKALIPPSCEVNAFLGVDKDAILYVPDIAIPFYRKAYGWKDFWNIQPIDEKYQE